MRKYIIIIIAAIILLWLASIIIYRNSLYQYLGNSVSGFLVGLLYLFIIGYGLYLIIRTLFR